MTESRCSKCDTLKPVEDFVTRKSTGRPVSWCKTCKREWDRESYRLGRGQGSDRKLRMRESTKNGQNRSRIIIWGHLNDNPCVDCGESDILVLEFDHLPGFEKTMEVSKMLGYSPDKILAEIAKCQVVCANCHRRRTAARSGWTKMLNTIPVSFSGRTTASGAVDEVSITSAGTMLT